MQIFITGIGLCCAFGIVATLSFFQDMKAVEKLPILALLFFIAVFSLMKMESKPTKSAIRHSSCDCEERSGVAIP